MTPTWFLVFPDDVAISTEAGGEFVLLGPQARVTLPQLSPGLQAALNRLVPSGERVDVLAESILAADGPAALARWYYFLQQLTQRGLLLLTAQTQARRLATLVPLSSTFVLNPRGPLPDRSYVLSRFAYIRRDGDGLVLESPLGPARLLLHDDRATGLVHALGRPGSLAELALRTPGSGVEAVRQMLGLLLSADMAREVSEEGTTVEDTEPALRIWEFHDLLYHCRSREGRHDAPVGATYHWAGKLPAPPALQPAADDGIDLHRPDLEQLQRQDPPLALVQEKRRSLRDYAPEPLTAQQLGEFLFRVARVRSCREVEIDTAAGPQQVEFTSRPYPAGGGLYELELYPVIQSCRDLVPGLYHYEPRHHRLEPRAGLTADVLRLVREAAQASGTAPEHVQVLLIVAARYPRLAWKYSTLAYALVLKHVGVLYQSMYLNATAMGLAPCALGDGNSDLFARAAGTDYYAETSVGEFLLGSRPPDE